MQLYLQPRQFCHRRRLVFNVACKPGQIAHHNSDPFVSGIAAELHHLLKPGPVCGSTRFPFIAEYLQHFQFFVFTEIVAFADLRGQIGAVATYLIVTANAHVDDCAFHLESRCLSRIRRISSANEMPKVTDCFFRALSWRSVSAILICFMALLAYTPNLPLSTPNNGPGCPRTFRGQQP